VKAAKKSLWGKIKYTTIFHDTTLITTFFHKYKSSIKKPLLGRLFWMKMR
jgi:hypothetical protein